MSQAHAIAEALERAIVRGELAAGTAVRQEELAERFGVSRMPIREAMRILQERGLLEQRGRGAIVHLPSAEEAHDLFLVRAELESFAAERAARRISRPQLDDLRQAQDAFRSEAAAYDVLGADDVAGRAEIFERISVANEVFHETVAQTADSRVLLDAILQLSRRVPRELSSIAMSHDPGLLFDGIADHEKVLAALEKGEERAARQQMRRHVLSAGATIVYWLKGHGKASRARLARMRAAEAEFGSE